MISIKEDESSQKHSQPPTVEQNPNLSAETTLVERSNGLQANRNVRHFSSALESHASFGSDLVLAQICLPPCMESLRGTKTWVFKSEY